MVRRLPLLVLLLATACGGAPRASEAERIADTLEILESAPPAAFHGRLLSLRTREFTTYEALLADALAARVVFVGETHTNPAHLAFQLELLRSLHAHDPRVAIGLEIPSPYQASLDAFRAGDLDEAGLLKTAEAGTRARVSLELRRPVLRFAARHGIPLVALDLPRELVRRIAGVGLESLRPDEKALLPDVDVTDAAHRELVTAGLRAHHAMPAAALEFAYEALCARDDGMAAAAAEALDGPAGRDRRLVVLVGSGHVRGRSGVPDRLTRRRDVPLLVVVPFEVAAAGEKPGWSRLVAGDDGDHVLITAPPPEKP